MSLSLDLKSLELQVIGVIFYYLWHEEYNRVHFRILGYAHDQETEDGCRFWLPSD